MLRWTTHVYAQIEPPIRRLNSHGLMSAAHQTLVCGRVICPNESQFRCAVLALSGHELVHCKCPLFGGKADMAYCTANVRF